MLFDDLIGAGEDRGRYRQAQRLGGLEVDDQLELWVRVLVAVPIGPRPCRFVLVFGRLWLHGDGMHRRRFIALLGAAVIAARTLRAQQKVMPVIGFLGLSSPGPFAGAVAAFHQGLRETGYVEGESVAVQYRWAEDSYDRLPAGAADLVARRVDVIITQGGFLSALAAKNATTTIPIVFMIGTDPVAAGLVASLARPGGNLTGFSLILDDLIAKRLELLCDLIPQAKVIGLMVRPDNPETEVFVRAVQEAAHVKGVELQILNDGDEGEIDAGFAMVAQVKVDALLVGSAPFFSSRRHQIVGLAARYAVPVIYDGREAVQAGGLISYGATSFTGTWRQVGVYVARVLKGEKPADLPVQQPTTFELVVNLKTARALGLTIPPSILARADEVIE
jgi:putative ABC transport system substrate-binding protein